MSVVTDIDPELLLTPAFFGDLLSAGVRVSLSDGQHYVQNLKIGGVTERQEFVR
jgi:hypothetical protein